MQLTEEYKEMIQWNIIDTITLALDENNVKNEELPEIAKYVMARIASITTHQQLVSFLIELSDRWPVFAQIANNEMGKAIEDKKGELVGDVMIKAQNGDIQGAIDLARGYTKN